MEPFSEAPRLRTVGDYQFGAGAGRALFPADADLTVERSASGRVTQVHAGDGRLVTRGTDGRFTLGLAGGRRLARALAPPANRVVVGAESAPYVRDERNAFAKFVRSVDPDVRPRDEVLVVDGEAEPAAEGEGTTGRAGALLAVGRAELPADAMADFDSGVAVTVREGAEE